MEPAEIGHRVRELRRRRSSRGDTGRWERFDAGPGRIARLDLFDGLFEGSLPELVARQLDEATAAFSEGILTLLGRRWPEPVLDAGGRIDPAIWTLDPVTGMHWPGADAYAFDIDFRFDSPRGDVKFVWEANRLQFLVAPAIWARRNNDAKLAGAILASVLSWMDANPPGRGVNWNSGIELALRLVSVVAAIVAALEPWIGPEEHHRLRTFAAAHGDWIARFPSLYSSANNHLVAEAMGLAAAGRLVPDLAEAAQWLATARKHLEDRTLALFHEDGVGAEQSPAYSAFTLEMLILGFALLGRDSIPPKVAERLAAAAAALEHFLDQGGHAPRIGDDDEGRVFTALGDPEPRYIASVVAAVAGFLERPNLAPPLRDPHWRDLLFTSPEAGTRLPDGTTTFDKGGYTIRRGTVSGREVHLAFDHGPIGFGGIAAHGHADALSIWMSLDGLPVLVDAGTYLYHGEGQNLRRFRVSNVHNTLTLDGASQSEPSGAFNWMPRRAQCILDRAGEGPPLKVKAHHDGYVSRFGVLHHREIIETASGFDIIDTLTGGKPRSAVEIAFLIAPDIDVTSQNHRVAARRGGETVMALVGPPDADVEIVRGDTETGRGLFSPRFGVLVPAATVLFRAKAETSRWQSSILIDPLS